MGIREEIEKLEGYRHRILNYEYETISRSHVLSILDEHLGKLIDEIPLKELPITKVLSGTLSNGALIWLDRELAEPGDHIAIYLRRKNESSS